MSQAVCWLPRRAERFPCPLVVLAALDLVTGLSVVADLAQPRVISQGDSLGATALMEEQQRKLMRSWSAHQDRVLATSRSSEFFSPQPRVVKIYYEALSPASGRLMSDKANGVWAAYNARKGSWRFDLYPWGRASRTSAGLQCTHGPAECVGNLMHMCALRTLPADVSFVVISCLMREPSSNLLQVDGASEGSWVYDDWTNSGGIHDYVSQVAKGCWSSISEPSWQTTVEACMNNRTLSMELETFYRAQTSAVKLTRVPSVFVNGSFHAKASAGTDLLSYLDA
mmetsp:Transcript_157774/g.294258  ORF Transcript_157774/g.294258 Transcript_157774/m.294258 type:complete len:283 (+) Transcript_157774:75-923(+)